MDEPKSTFQTLHDEFMKRIDGDEKPEYMIALAILMLATEVNDLTLTVERSLSYICDNIRR